MGEVGFCLLDAIADRATDDTDGKGKSGDCGDEVVWADDRGCDRGQIQCPGGKLFPVDLLMMDAGTTIPPMPRPATIRMPQTTWRLSLVATDRAPQPAVMRMHEITMSNLI